jgi:hypothetical protein
MMRAVDTLREKKVTAQVPQLSFCWPERVLTMAVPKRNYKLKKKSRSLLELFYLAQSFKIFLVKSSFFLIKY